MDTNVFLSILFWNLEYTNQYVYDEWIAQQVSIMNVISRHKSI